MRPKPARNHHLAIAVLVAVVAANALLTCRQHDLTDDQANMLAEAHKQRDTALYAGDEVFGPSGPGAPWRLRQPAWRAILTTAAVLTGGNDPLTAFRLLGAAMLFLVGLQLSVFWVVMRVLEGLSQREADVKRDLEGVS